ncbi:hypothetical protein DMN91_000545 [Ooceraea biroi]|uniref:GIY-YIG domain-containing protein n=1 Tax=Ooceraea biroi TaxID=2015173 RepID=A0A3L8E429_OOCBI|nr:uncharacterized protein LOC105282758 [Ooceraea biroi]RLU26748.1 hypothetical protein DMN91_000545 [Ooceraea biroi]
MLITNWYRKPTFSRRYMNYFSNHPSQHKISVVKSLVDRAVLLSDSRFHTANLSLVRDILINNCYPAGFINKHIKKRIKEIKYKETAHPAAVNNQVSKDTFIKIPFVNNVSEMIKKSLNKYGVRTVFSISNKLDGIVKLGKDRLDSKLLSGVVYKIDCNNCSACYIGQTKRHLETRLKEHMANVKKDVGCYSVVSKHRVDCGHEFDWLGVDVLHRENNTKKRELAEMFFIKRHEYTINSQKDTENWPSVYDNFVTNT